MGALYFFFDKSMKQTGELEQTEEIFKEISLNNKTHEERKKEAKVLKQLKGESECVKSNSFPEIEFWDNQGMICNKTTDCKLIFEEELKDIYEPNELPVINNEIPNWTIGMWLKSEIDENKNWTNIFRRMEENPISLKDRRPGLWFVPNEKSLRFTYAVTVQTEKGPENTHRYIDIRNAYKKDEWFHVAWVQKNEKGYIYINGVLRAVKEHDIKPEIINNNEKLYIAPRNNHKIKKFTFCATPLSQESVKKMYRLTNK
jgi:hypothetical protein